MRKKDNLKLGFISKIDEKYIDEVTDSRIALSKRIKTGMSRAAKRFIAIGSVAASFILICSVFFTVILPMLIPTTPDQYVPIYRGMSVAHENIIEQLSETKTTPIKEYLSPYDVQSDTDTDTEAATETESTPIPDLDITGADRSIYYAKPNQDIFIKVHIENPKQYEILSFTLNGFKYQSYMFEANSNSEELILKVNVGDFEKLIVEYTIDAIKYVDGEEIKDVRMEGDKTIKVGVYPENQPTVEVSNITTEYNTIKFDVSVLDEMALIKDSDGEVYAAIANADCTEILDEIELSIDGENDRKFENLVSGQEYTLLIIAYYDAFDGEYFAMHTLYKEHITTAPYLSNVISSQYISTNDNVIEFNINIPAFKSARIEKVELVAENGDIRQTSNATSGKFTRIFPMIYSDYSNYSEPFENFTLRAIYTFDLGDGQGIRHGITEGNYHRVGANWMMVLSESEWVDSSYGNLISTSSDGTIYAVITGTVHISERGSTVSAYGGALTYRYAFTDIDELYVTDGQQVTAGDKLCTIKPCSCNDVSLVHIHIGGFLVYDKTV